MPAALQAKCRNRLLSLMSEQDFARLAPHLEAASSPKGRHLAEPGDVIAHVHFPESGVVSLVAISPEGEKVEAGLFGREGFGPAPAALGSDRSPTEMIVQVAGDCYRLPRAALVQAMDESASLRDLLLRYVQVLLLQTSHTALANAVHQVDVRLARWLLMVHDRSDSDDLMLTHDSIAIMLAVRRPSVTTSLHVLEGHRLIRNERRHIAIRNRPALEAFATDSYGLPEAEYRRLIGPM